LIPNMLQMCLILLEILICNKQGWRSWPNNFRIQVLPQLVAYWVGLIIIIIIIIQTRVWKCWDEFHNNRSIEKWMYQLTNIHEWWRGYIDIILKGGVILLQHVYYISNSTTYLAEYMKFIRHFITNTTKLK
jgi:hypothetical protein